MNVIERAVRRALNPVSTWVTTRVQVWHRRTAHSVGGLGRTLAPRPGVREWARPVPSPAPAGRDEVVVPDVVGATFDSARATLSRLGLGARQPEGTAFVAAGSVVVAQYPEPGAMVRRGVVVTLWTRRDPGSAGVREPRRPYPDDTVARGEVDESSAEALG